MSAEIVIADTVTNIAAQAPGFVLVTGSHGGRIAAYLAANAGARAVIFNDAGRGLDDAGVLGLDDLDQIGVAAVCVSHVSARIADARDTYANGTLSALNKTAVSCGAVVGMTAKDCAALFQLRAGLPRARAVARHNGRMQLAPQVVGLDSIGLLARGDAHQILFIGSHGALHGGRPESALDVDAVFAVFHDAGVGKEKIGVSRLPVLEARGSAASCVDYRSARIGDARSMWETGIISHCNASAHAFGVRVGALAQACATHIVRVQT
jgi:hypothetical protein